MLNPNPSFISFSIILTQLQASVNPTAYDPFASKRKSFSWAFSPTHLHSAMCYLLLFVLEEKIKQSFTF